jgi:hypothetical protein
MGMLLHRHRDRHEEVVEVSPQTEAPAAEPVTGAEEPQKEEPVKGSKKKKEE